MSLLEGFRQRWKLYCVMLLIGVCISAFVSYISQKELSVQLTELGTQCEEKYGRDNYVLGRCETGKLCCVSKERFDVQKEVPVGLNISMEIHK